MATRTRSFNAYRAVGVVFQYDYDDVTMLVSAVRCINQTRHDARAEITIDTASPRVANRGRSYSRTFGQGTTTLDIPQAAASRIELAAGEKGYPVGCYLTLKWPAD